MNNIKTFESFIAEAVKKGIESALAEGKGKSTDKSDNFDHVGKKHLKDENSKKEIKKAKKITRSQLAEGVRKALRMALKETSGYAQEGLSDGDVTKRGTSTYGNVPSPEELQAALNEQGGWDMDLKGVTILPLHTHLKWQA